MSRPNTQPSSDLVTDATLPPLVASFISHVANFASPRNAAIRLRAMVRGNEFFLIPLACIVGVVAGLVVTVMSEITQIAHTVIYGIPLDVRLSATVQVHPATALAAPTLGNPFTTPAPAAAVTRSTRTASARTSARNRASHSTSRSPR